MKRLSIWAVFAGMLGLGWIATGAPEAASGGSKLKFRVLYTSSHLPAEAQKVLKGAHGGFAIDRRPGKGEIYFFLKGAGIIEISADLKKTRMIATDPAMRDTNMHNAKIWYAPDGSAHLVFPGNESNKVFTTAVNGKLEHTLDEPTKADDLGHPAPNEYFAAGGKFIPTDVEFLDGLYYIATGYSKLDYVLTAKVGFKPLSATWHDLAFGGKGNGPGQFGTGHGITVPPGAKRLDVADRPNSEIDRFTRYGQFLSTLNLPKGSFPCDIDYEGKYGIVGALHGPDRTQGAPIYVLEKDEIVATIMAKTELGLGNFQHVHNAVIREIGGKVYVIAQAWNPGDFAIFEQVIN
jgi:hypothetical protein